MDTKSMTRKEFVTLTFTLIGSAAAACSSSSSSNDGGTGGSTGSGGNGSGGHGTGGSGSVSCADPLPETQVPDQTGHTHTVTIPVSDLSSTSDQIIDTSLTLDHMHAVTLTIANLLTLKGGGQVTVTSAAAGVGPHTHMFMVSCGATTGAAGSSGAAGHLGDGGHTGGGGHLGDGGHLGGGGHTGAAGDTGAAGNTGAAGA